MDWLYPVYIAATVFGAGITVVDFLGLLGGQSEGEGGEDTGGEDYGDADTGEIDTSGADTSGADTGGEDTGGEDTGGEDTGGEEADGGETDDGRPSYLAHDRRQRGMWVLRTMSAARNLVYFSLGFGPVGWYALSRSEAAASSLVWSIPVGVAVLFGARVLRRVLRHELDSQLKSADLVMEKGLVIVTIGAGRMGKVRVSVGGTYTDRFARAKDAEESIPQGTTVRVVDVSDECVYVERESE